MKVPLPTVIHVEHLPPPSRRRLRDIAAREAAITPTAAARLPLPPGRYVIGAFVVDATRELLTVVPIARTRPAVERRWGHAALRFDSEAGPCRVAVPAAHLERVLTWMHGDVVAYAAALAAGDRATAGQLDPLAEARDQDGTVIGVPGPPRGRIGLALARWR